MEHLSNRAHGTAGRYQEGCKCDVCTDANTQRNEESRLKRLGRTPTVHNASTYRNWGCNCTECRSDHLKLQASKRNAAGRGKNRRKEWTSADLDYAIQKADDRRYARTALQTALDLGRSVSAVNRVRSMARVNSRS